MAERISELFRDNLLTDRTIIDVVAFTNRAKSITQQDKLDFEHYAIKFLPEYDYIFYVSPEGVEIENNNVRETDANYRLEIDKEIQYLLKRYGVNNIYNLPPYLSNEERINYILKTIKL
jgi:hypothetical protein